jgi:hypothetical protein
VSPERDTLHRTPNSPQTDLAAGAWRRIALHRARQPMQNGFVESFNGRLRDECLNEHLFVTSMRHARSSKNGGSTTTPTDRTRASTGSHQPSSQHAPIRGIRNRLSLCTATNRRAGQWSCLPWHSRGAIVAAPPQDKGCWKRDALLSRTKFALGVVSLRSRSSD